MIPFDLNGKFQPNGEVATLRRRAVRGAGITVFSQGVVFVAQMASTIILARLLTPTDFGLVAMVTTFSLLLANFGLNGFSEAIIQREEINHFLASNLFWISVGGALVLSIAFAAAGSELARFYGDQRVAHIAVAMSLAIFMSSGSVVHLALLKRDMRFSATSANGVVAGAVAVAVTIALAWAGWGYWSLVAGAIVQPTILAIGAWYLCRWVPSLPRRVPGTGSVIRFALNVYGRFSFNYFTRNTDNLLVGWQFGSSSLGFYKKAYDLFLLPANQLITPVADVVLSALSKVERGSAEYKRYFLNGLSILSLVGMAAGAVLTLSGRDLIRVLLGAKWGAAGQVFVFFGPGIGIMMIYSASGLIHLSIGRADRWFRWVVVEFGVTVVLFILGLHWGPVGVASAWTTSFWILAIPAFWYAGRPIHFGVAPVLAVVWKFALASLLAAGASIVIIHRISSLMVASGIFGALARIATISVLFLVLYVAAVILLHGGTGPIRSLVGLLPDMLPGARSSESRRPEAAARNSERRWKDIATVSEGARRTVERNK